MKLVDMLAARAAEAESRLGELAAAGLENLERKKALGRIEDAFEQMAADGVIDDDELEDLKANMRGVGLDASELDRVFEELRGADSVVRLEEGGGELAELVRGTLDDARAELSDNQADLQFAIQTEVGDHTHFLEAASRVSKLEHDAYMTAIRNLKA